MRQSRKFIAGALGAFLFSGVALAGANAEMFEAEAVAPARPTSPVLPVAAPQPAAAAEAQPATPATAPAPADSPTAAPSPAAAPGPARRAAAAASTNVDTELACLARVILYEAGAESRAGQLAVGQVVMNRVRSPRFPNTICGVINQRGQFSAIRSFHPPRNARWRRALSVAREARAGARAPGIGNALFFHASHVPAFRGRVRVARLGGHVFYR